MNKPFTLFLVVLLLVFAVMNFIEGDIGFAVLDLAFGVAELVVYFTKE